MAKKPDAAFIERCTKLWDSIDGATDEQVKQHGRDSVETAYALATQGRMARWTQKNLGEGAKGLERAVVISESQGLGPELSSRWLRTLCVVWDDLGEAHKAIAAAEKAHALSAPLRGQMHPETIAAAAGLVRTMRLAIHPVGPELRELAGIWPTLSEAERKVQIEVLKRFVHRRKDLSPEDIERINKITIEPQGVAAVLPPPEPKADKAELAKVMAELDRSEE